MQTTVMLSLTELEQFDPHAGGADRRERRFCCPLCGHEKPMDADHRSLAVNTETGVWNCHRCGAKGLLAEYKTDRPYQTRQERGRASLRRTFNLTPEPTQAPDPKSTEGLQRQLKSVKPFAGSPAEAYLESRGIPSEIAHAAEVNYSPSWGGIGPAVVFPIRDRERKLVAAQGRAIKGDGKKTFGPKSLGVFATYGALEAELRAVCEAPIDALSLAACGYPAIALCGKDAPDWLSSTLAFKTVLIATDSDAAGEEAARKLVAGIQRYGGKCHRLKPSGKDWNDVLRDWGIPALTEWLRENLAAIVTEGLANNTVDSTGEASEDLGEVDSDPLNGDLILPDFASLKKGGEQTAKTTEKQQVAEDIDLLALSQDQRVREKELATRIREHLAGRSVPIPICPGQSIADVELYAVSEARSVLCLSPTVSGPACERLGLLGVDLGGVSAADRGII